MSESGSTAEEWRAAGRWSTTAGPLRAGGRGVGRRGQARPRPPRNAEQPRRRLSSRSASSTTLPWHFEEAASLRPSYADAWENLAGVLLASNRQEDAIASGAGSSGPFPGSAPAHVVLATTLASRGRFDEAAQACHNGLSPRPDDADLLLRARQHPRRPTGGGPPRRPTRTRKSSSAQAAAGRPREPRRLPRRIATSANSGGRSLPRGVEPRRRIAPTRRCTWRTCWTVWTNTKSRPRRQQNGLRTFARTTPPR